MDRLWKIVCGVVALVAVGAALAFEPVAARADEGATVSSSGGVTLDPAYQIGNAQGDHGQ